MNIINEYNISKHSKISGDIGKFTGYFVWLILYVFGKLCYHGIMFIVRKMTKVKK
jgi:hypothetical protein